MFFSFAVSFLHLVVPDWTLASRIHVSEISDARPEAIHEDEMPPGSSQSSPLCRVRCLIASNDQVAQVFNSKYGQRFTVISVKGSGTFRYVDTQTYSSFANKSWRTLIKVDCRELVYAIIESEGVKTTVAANTFIPATGSYRNLLQYACRR